MIENHILSTNGLRKRKKKSKERKANKQIKKGKKIKEWVSRREKESDSKSKFDDKFGKGKISMNEINEYISGVQMDIAD